MVGGLEIQGLSGALLVHERDQKLVCCMWATYCDRLALWMLLAVNMHRSPLDSLGEGEMSSSGRHACSSCERSAPGYRCYHSSALSLLLSPENARTSPSHPEDIPPATSTVAYRNSCMPEWALLRMLYLHKENGTLFLIAPNGPHHFQK